MAVSPAFATKPPRLPEPLPLPDGSWAQIRPVRPEDRAALIAFHRSLSNKTVYLRYFSPVSVQWRTSPKRLAEELYADPEHHCTLVIERRAGGSGLRHLIGVGRLVVPNTAPDTADFAMAIRDDFQGMGLGTALLGALIEQARQAGLRAITAEILAENRSMLEICRRFGFELAFSGGGDPVEARLELSNAHSV